MVTSSTETSRGDKWSERSVKMDDKKARAILDMAASEKAHIFKVKKKLRQTWVENELKKLHYMCLNDYQTKTRLIIWQV